MDKEKIVGIKMGQKIEEKFNIPGMLEEGKPVEISMKDIVEKIPEYSKGNGHDPLRDRSKGGERIGYLPYKYNLEKRHKNENNKNSAIDSLIFKDFKDKNKK